MLQKYDTTELLEIQDILIKKVENFKNSIKIEFQLQIKPHIGPVCGCTTTKLHDYRTHTIKDIPMLSKTTIFVYTKRRYACKCGKKIVENNTFLPKYYRITSSVKLGVFVHL